MRRSCLFSRSHRFVGCACKRKFLSQIKMPVATCKRLERVNLDDFSSTAEQVSSLDLVISVDTSVAHLAGALNVPVWILLAKASDWRWLLDRDDSPWYPTAWLFRQRQAGDWNEVVHRVSEELKKKVASGEWRVTSSEPAPQR